MENHLDILLEALASLNDEVTHTHRPDDLVQAVQEEEITGVIAVSMSNKHIHHSRY